MNILVIGYDYTETILGGTVIPNIESDDAALDAASHWCEYEEANDDMIHIKVFELKPDWGPGRRIERRRPPVCF